MKMPVLALAAALSVSIGGNGWATVPAAASIARSGAGVHPGFVPAQAGESPRAGDAEQKKSSVLKSGKKTGLKKGNLPMKDNGSSPPKSVKSPPKKKSSTGQSPHEKHMKYQ